MDSNKNNTSTSKPKNKNKLLKMLPKAMSFGHRVPPFSPGNKMFFSGPMVPLVPNAARARRTKTEPVWDEPTSPKVSCIGQIKIGKSKRSPTKNKNKADKTFSSLTKEDEKGRLSKIKRLFSKKPRPTAAAEHQVNMVSAAAGAPSLGNMKKFASSRDALGGFDWAVAMNKVAEEEEEEESRCDHHRRGYYSDDDDDRRRDYLREDDDEEEDDIIIPFSAPLSLKPKKEVNLWKRRTMEPPKPLHL